jgi:sigma-54 dependent transcriptional regulator, acetoin dehydrogenase operon transcriptional activator AcoR
VLRETMPPTPERRGPGDITARTRERFLAGEDVDAGVRPEVLLSWHRCRDDYGVDPSQERAPSSPVREPSQLLDEKVAVAELAVLAKAIEHDVRAIGALVAVADARGGILAAWGDSAALRLAADVNLAARCAWSERTAGTNGMGTALAAEGPVSIRGAEHWCTGFRDWDCAGVAMRDPVARRPLGVLGVSSRKEPLPKQVLSWLQAAQAAIESGLRHQALLAYRDLAAVYRQEVRTAQGPLAAADTAGRLLLANADAGAYFGIVHPDRPWELTDTMPQLRAALRAAVDRAQRESGWMGIGRLPIAGRDETVPVAVRPAIRDERLVGILIAAFDDAVDGEALILGDAVSPPDEPGRVIGLKDDRMVLVSAEEIRYAETDGGKVWLDTDRGRLRVPERSFGALEQRLGGQGFVRVHRQYLVNRRRVEEVAPAGDGCIQLLLDVPGPAIPVARRRTAGVRRSLSFR